MNTQFLNYLKASESEVREWPSWKSLSLDGQPSAHQGHESYESTYVTSTLQRVEATEINETPLSINSGTDK